MILNTNVVEFTLPKNRGEEKISSVLRRLKLLGAVRFNYEINDLQCTMVIESKIRYQTRVCEYLQKLDNVRILK